jgi:hypothetical protein
MSISFKKLKLNAEFCHEVKQGKFWKKFHWKYKSPNGYKNWKDAVFMGGAVCLEDAFDAAIHVRDPYHLEAHLCGRAAVEVDAPAVFLRKELAEAFLLTDIDAMQRPNKVLDALFVMLPLNLIKGDENDCIYYLLVVNEEFYCSRLKELQNQLFGTEISLMSSGEGLRVVGYSDKSKYINAKSWQHPTTHVDIRYDPLNYIVNEKKFEKTCQKMMKIAKNVILLYNYERHLIQEEQSLSFAVSREQKSSNKNPFPITWLGSAFKHKKVFDHEPFAKDAGRPVRAHWRKGHWHRYWCGEGRAKQVVRWVQPVYVGKASV